MDGPRGTVHSATDGPGRPSAVAMDGPGDQLLHICIYIRRLFDDL